MSYHVCLTTLKGRETDYLIPAVTLSGWCFGGSLPVSPPQRSSGYVRLLTADRYYTGGHIVDGYPYAHAEDPIVSGLIAMSGNSGPTANGPTENFSRVAARLGCGDLDAEEELACMQKVDARDIQELLEFGDDVPMFGAIADNTTIFPSNAERLEKGLIAKLVRHPDRPTMHKLAKKKPQPMITGNTVNEAAAFGPGFTLNQTEPPESPSPMPEFGCGIQKNIE